MKRDGDDGDKIRLVVVEREDERKNGRSSGKRHFFGLERVFVRYEVTEG